MSLRLALSRIGFRWRLAAALLCLLFAGVSAVEGRASPDTPRAGRVVVAARALPAGHRLVASDLRVVSVAASWPGATSRTGRLVGRALAGPVASGEPVTALRLVEHSLTATLDDDLVALPVDLASDVRGLVRTGGRVDLLAVPETGEQARPVARHALVLAVLSPTGSESGCRLVLAVPRDGASRIVGAGASGTFRVAALAP